jgi:hypothetical protein
MIITYKRGRENIFTKCVKIVIFNANIITSKTHL